MKWVFLLYLIPYSCSWYMQMCMSIKSILHELHTNYASYAESISPPFLNGSITIGRNIMMMISGLNNVYMDMPLLPHHPTSIKGNNTPPFHTYLSTYQAIFLPSSTNPSFTWSWCIKGRYVLYTCIISLPMYLPIYLAVIPIHSLYLLTSSRLPT